MIRAFSKISQPILYMNQRLPESATADSDFGINGFQRGKRLLPISATAVAHKGLVRIFLIYLP